MATIERLREVGRLATQHYERPYRERRGEVHTASSYRILHEYLKVFVHPVDVSITPEAEAAGLVKTWQEPTPTTCADFGFYQRLLRFLKTDLNHWVGQDRGSVQYELGHTSSYATHQGAAHLSSKLRWMTAIHPNGQIELEGYQDGLMGPGRTNGARYSIETKNYRSLSPREQLWWRYIARRLGHWLSTQGFVDHSEPDFADPEEHIEWHVRQTGHFYGEETIYSPRVGRPSIANPGYDDLDAMKKPLVNGDTKFFFFGGRLVRGRVFYKLGNMWYVVMAGRVWYMASHDLHNWIHEMAGVRRWLPLEARVQRLQRVQTKLIEAEQFERAAKVRDVIRRHKSTIDALAACPKMRSFYVPLRASR